MEPTEHGQEKLWFESKSGQKRQKIYPNKLSEEMKVSLDFIKSIEKGRSCVSLDNLELLCEILDRSPNYFFEDNSNALIEENLELYLKFKELDKENLKTLSKWLNALVEND